MISPLLIRSQDICFKESLDIVHSLATRVVKLVRPCGWFLALWVLSYGGVRHLKVLLWILNVSLALQVIVLDTHTRRIDKVRQRISWELREHGVSTLLKSCDLTLNLFALSFHWLLCSRIPLILSWLASFIGLLVLSLFVETYQVFIILGGFFDKPRACMSTSLREYPPRHIRKVLLLLVLLMFSDNICNQVLWYSVYLSSLLLHC